MQSIPAQSNMGIHFKYCEVRPHLNCFNPVPGAVDTVGRNVFELGGGFKFCLKIDTVDAGFAPIRVVLVLDQSYSMCRNPRGDCCTAGDSSNNCMMNDPNDMRIVAAHAFVDSLVKKSPNSSVGVVVYDQDAFATNPLKLNDQNNVVSIHAAIDKASCIAHNWPPLTPSPPDGLAKITKTKETYLGEGMAAGLTTIDYNYDSIIGVSRHIIQLTDGAWDDKVANLATPDTLINAYKAQFPGRPVPTIHGVFLSNVQLHELHGYPPEGCSNDLPVILGKLETATKLTGGLYISGATPQTVVDYFNKLLNRMTERLPQQLTGMIVTNTTTGDVRNQKTISQVDTSMTDSVSYEATLDNLPLVMGLNTLKVQRIIKKPGTDILDTVPSTVSIYRVEDWTSQIDPKEFDLFCVPDSTAISIKVTPSVTPVNSPFTVDAAITMKNKLILDNVEVRAFTQFPDDAVNTKAVFHLEQNLKNSAAVGGEATGSSVAYNQTDTLFGRSVMSQGSFKTSIAAIAGDFALEAWIRPSPAGGQTDIFSGNGFTFGIGADRILYFTPAGAQQVKSSVAVDANAWSHVAISRVAGAVRIYINAVDVSTPVQFTSALQGDLTIACPIGGLLDEVRISDHNRMRENSNFPRLDIPSLQNPTWIINGQSKTQPILVLSPTMWNNGNIRFQFSSPLPLQAVINFQHLGPVESRWSKNGNSVYAIGDLIPIVSIKVTPDTVLINNPFKVQSTIILQPWIILDTVEVRIFTQFPDVEKNTVAVFHLERNLTNSTNGSEGTGSTADFTEAEALFGNSAINQGSFSTTITIIPTDFALEAWIKPSNAGEKTDIFSGSGFTFGIGADRMLYFTANGTELARAAVAVDGNTWSHVAVSRISGNLTIFINGVNVSQPVQFAGVLAGAITMSCPISGVLDEIRISNTSRIRPDPEFLRFDIPSVQKPTWTLAGQSSTQPVLFISPDKWNNGNIEFQFTIPVHGKIVVNFQHKGTGFQTQWSENGNPVFSAADLSGPYVTKAIFTNGLIGDIWDTLKVFFSEPVRCDSLKKNLDPSTSFKIYGPGNILKDTIFNGAHYLDNNACPDNKRIQEVTIITMASVDGIVPKKDCIRLFGSAVDTAGNYPDTTKCGPIEYGPGSGITIRAYQNAVNERPMIIPEGFSRRTGVPQVEGKAIVIQTRGTLIPGFTPEGKPTFGKTILYDAVANVVAVDLPIEQFKNNERMYYVIWNGTNRLGRRVSSGAYLLRATVQYTNEPEKYVPIQTKFSIKW